MKITNRIIIGVLVIFIFAVIALNVPVRYYEKFTTTEPINYKQFSKSFNQKDVVPVSNWVIAHAMYYIKQNVKFSGCSSNLLENGMTVMDKVVESTGVVDVAKSIKPLIVNTNTCMDHAIKNDYNYYGIANVEYNENGNPNMDKGTCYMSNTSKGITDLMANSDNPNVRFDGGNVPWQGKYGCGQNQTSGQVLGNKGSIASYSLENVSLKNAINQANNAITNATDSNNGIILCIKSLVSLNSALYSMDLINEHGDVPINVSSLTIFPKLSTTSQTPLQFNPYSTEFLNSLTQSHKSEQSTRTTQNSQQVVRSELNQFPMSTTLPSQQNQQTGLTPMSSQMTQMTQMQ